MTSTLNEEVVLQFSSTPPLLTADGVSASVATTRASVYSGSVELGRRLLLASRHGDTAQVLDLMAKGAPFTTDWLGTSPLHLAASNAHADTCAVLLRAGVSRDARTKVERTPLHFAAHAGHASVCALLLDYGALVDCRDMLRMTPLHWAAARGHAATAAVLLQHGADPHARSKFHKSPHSLAAAGRREDLLKLMEDALKDREAANSVDALALATQDEQMKEVTAAEQQRALESIERLEEIGKPPQKQEPVHADTEPVRIDIDGAPAESPSGGEQNSVLAAQILKKHGITLLPHDYTSTVLNAIQSGRTVVLSDAGKLMLKENSSLPGPKLSTASVTVPATPTAHTTSKGVILTAAPVKSPPKPGVKIFTLNNTLLAMPKENKAPIKKVINPHDMQIKFVSIPEDRKLISSSRVSMKAKTRSRVSVLPAGGATGAIGGGGSGAGGAASLTRAPASGQSGRGAVKIVLNKANFNKMLAGKGVVENGIELRSNTITPTSELAKVLHGNTAPVTASAPVTATAPTSVASGGGGGGGSFLCVPQEFLSSNSTQYLRAQLLSAHQTIQDLNNQLSALKQRLATYEDV